MEGTELTLLTQKLRADNTSGVKGVCFDKRTSRFMAYIKLRGKMRYLGRFDTVEEAARVRRQAEEELFAPILEAHGRELGEEDDAR